ncbi:MAG: type II toxin-antitoxin system VapC family toxin [Actinobacteria bacterium]|nr:MAG: type II toxin-antitoxin system VapC family toxin [Actinomycetota bacterium]
MAAETPLVVIDASVAVKWFVADDEPGAEAARRLLDEHVEGRVRLVAPSLLVHELAGVLARGSARRRPDVTDALDAFFDSGVALVPPDRDLSLRAAHTAAAHGVSAFDSAYVALAETLACALATSDRRLARSAGRVVTVRAT